MSASDSGWPEGDGEGETAEELRRALAKVAEQDATISRLEKRTDLLLKERNELLLWQSRVKEFVCTLATRGAEVHAPLAEYSLDSVASSGENANGLRAYLLFLNEVHRQAQVTLSAPCLCTVPQTYHVKLALPVGATFNFSKALKQDMPDRQLSFDTLLTGTKRFNQVCPGILLTDSTGSDFATMPFVARLQALEVDTIDGKDVVAANSVTREVVSSDFKKICGGNTFSIGEVGVPDSTVRFLAGDKNQLIAFSGNGSCETVSKPVYFYFRLNRHATNRNFVHKTQESRLRFRFAIQPGLDKNKWNAYWSRVSDGTTVPEIPTFHSEFFNIKTRGSTEHAGTSVAQKKRKAAEKAERLATMTANELGSLVSAPPIERVRKRGRPPKTTERERIAVRSVVSYRDVDYVSDGSPAVGRR